MTPREPAPPVPGPHPDDPLQALPATVEEPRDLVSQLRAANEALAAQRRAAEAGEARLGLILESLSDGYCALDVELRITSVNAAAERIWNRPRDLLLGRRLAEALPDVAAASIDQAIVAARETGHPTLFEARSPVQGAWIAGRATPTPAGVVVSFQGNPADRAGRGAESQYRTLLNSIDIGFCVFEVLFAPNGEATDYRFLETNPVFEQLTGLNGAPGKCARQLVPGLEAHWFEIYGQVAATGEAVRFEQQSHAMNDRWFDVYACRLGGPDSRRVALLFTNVTERKRWERGQEDFVGMVSHDLGNPLAVVRGWAQLLRRRQTYDATGIDAIIEQTRRMERLVIDLRELVRVETDQVELVLAAVDLVPLAHAATARARVQAPSHPVRVEAPPASIMASVDAGRIGQVLDNLLGNAGKYSAPASEITIRVTAGPGTARLQVTDRGAGIPADVLPRLFDRFVRGASPNGGQGLGLGLYISRMLVEAHGGRIAATSEVGRGSTFTIT
ncbi:MAG: PAS domain-containing sensor histidine kinase, partial [Chloroflexia bacterium]|nr:PAS domain-containing sensor histidine kinase [Chloroflexia bacterium]